MAIIVNSPVVFRLIWAIIRNWLDKDTVSRIHIHGGLNDALRQTLWSMGMNGENLPTWLGGIAECIPVVEMIEEAINGGGVEVGLKPDTLKKLLQYDLNTPRIHDSAQASTNTMDSSHAGQSTHVQKIMDTRFPHDGIFIFTGSILLMLVIAFCIWFLSSPPTSNLAFANLTKATLSCRREIGNGPSETNGHVSECFLLEVSDVNFEHFVKSVGNC